MSEDRSIQAINHVLRVEADSNAAIEACRTQARDIVDSGREQARRIISRIDKRISTIHVKADLTVGRRLEEIQHEIESLAYAEEPDAATLTHLQVAVDALLDEMVGGKP